MGNHRDLQVWQRSHTLAPRVDLESRRFAKGNAELADQLRRATMSIPTNLAEGSSRRRDGDYARYAGIAIGSAAETDSLLLHAAKVSAIGQAAYVDVLDELTIIRRMLFELRSAITPSRSARREPSPREPKA